MSNQKKVSFFHLLLPILFLIILIVYGLIIQPKLLNQPPFPLEVIFLLATVFSSAHLLFLGYSWKTIQDSIVAKLSKGFPAVLILFAIGIIIGTWIISGTIPMLIYYGIKLINPSYMYILAFLVPIIFSTMTGTSWGSVGTIGAVIIGVASSVEANLGITAGAIIGGAYFGDKMSPLSDTTNLAAMAVDIDLYDHIRSMMYTTIPSAIISSIVFFSMGFVYPPLRTEINGVEITETLSAIESMFSFNIFLLTPPLIVLYGSLRKKETLPVLLASAIAACVLALIFQKFGIDDVMTVLKSGFNTNMAPWISEVPEQLHKLFNRGGLFELNEVIVFTLMVLTFIGIIDVTNAMPNIVNRVFSFAKTRSAIILSSLFSTAFTNSITSNQSATSFIIGDAFKRRYDEYKISRRVLSRSIEDYGTMLESVVPWTATTLFMSTTLGVNFEDYWHWQLLSLINLIIAPLLAILGIGCFYDKKKDLK
ncbi:Na+/H+ antiporter NhaC [Aquimarina sp. 2201CG5-10]|uniref:Na+/H+ antiporter NhaC n=1 Tax=Aquimarina callyspongiae TaxID=3098150 RepID=UPI002AB43A92|nr:Na+/H+ antiporter NhaC [Aquimarina sp. 2201CG5-10]MDY8137753.1 Na+/H+ antiporter NhaC [Aquimarina sp. 2201CG5-10]